MTSVVLPEGLKKIGTIAFKGTNLDEVTLPKSLASVGSSAFEENASLSKVSIKGKRSLQGQHLEIARI